MDFFSKIVLILLASLTYKMQCQVTLTKEEDFELENQLKILNKPPIKSIEDESGDVFDCIDINRQPAFDHPLLKDHQIQMEPTSMPKSNVKTNLLGNEKMDSFLKGIQCPQGTVPIRRTTKEDLIRTKAFKKGNPNNIHTLVGPLPGQSRAIYRCHLTNGKKYHGAQAYMSVSNPKVDATQRSASLIWVDDGTMDDQGTASLQAGWAVAPKIYGDSNTRFISHWQTFSHGRMTGGCYNNLCPGFVHVDRRFPLNKVLSSTSVYEGTQFTIQVSIHKDKVTGNWWLTIPSKSVKIGYWPKVLLPQLTRGADHIGWGGLITMSPNGVCPPMGFGTFPDRTLNHSGNFYRVSAINEYNQLALPYGMCDKLVDKPRFYSLIDRGNMGGNSGHVFSYGGPGGICGA